jgi:hypothetical protein
MEDHVLLLLLDGMNRRLTQVAEVDEEQPYWQGGE